MLDKPKLQYGGKLLIFPTKGVLLVISDLHGAFQDFQRMEEKFYQALIEYFELKRYLTFIHRLHMGIQGLTPYEKFLKTKKQKGGEVIMEVA